MARFALVATICATALCVGNNGVLAQEKDIEKGLEYATKAVQSVCWYERLKLKPDTNPRAAKYPECYVNLNLKETGDEWIKKYPGQGYAVIKQSMAKWKKPKVEEYLPAQYSECNDYLMDLEKQFGEDKSDILEDGSGSYPYKGWAHCLMAKMEKTHGQEAVDAIKEKWSSPNKWMDELLKRENLNRARHGASALTINEDLNRKAQEWADSVAARCPNPLSLPDHAPDDNPGLQHEGRPTGENIGQGSTQIPPEDNSLVIANAWYEEISAYPWPEYTGNGYDHLFHEIGHFTSSMWKGSKEVGYGYGKRDGCDQVYIVGRYFPQGNIPGKFGANIPKPSD